MSETEIQLNVESIAPNHELIKIEETTQLDSRRVSRGRGGGIQPPYNPDRLAGFIELNETHAMAVRKKARWEVGFGFDIVPHDDPLRDEDDEFDPNEDQRDTLRDFWFGQDSRWLAGPEGTEPTTPTEVLELARQDYHAVGWCALEILARNDGTPVGLAYVPARTIRVRGSESVETDENGNERVVSRSIETGYVQVRDGRTRYFGEAGDRYGDDPTFVDAKTGKVGSEVETPANELIFMRNPSPLEDHYGVPEWVSAIRTITADEAAKDYNRDFFEFNTVPRMVVKVKGGTLSEDSKTDLRETIYDLRGKNRRTVILEVEEFLDAELDEDVDIELEVLDQGGEDMDFQAYRQANEHDIAKVHEVPPILINVTETSNRSNSDAQIHAFATETIAPEASKFAGRLYEIIHKTALDCPDWTLAFELRGGDQPKEDARLAREMIQAVDGAVTVNEAREAAGWGPVPEEADLEGDELLSDIGGPDPQPGFGQTLTVEDQRPPEANKIGEVSADKAVEKLEPFEIVHFDSSNINVGGYDFGESELYITFHRDGGVDSQYFYQDVPESEWEGLKNASSHGRYHYENIRLTYAYEEITGNHDRLPGQPAPDETPTRRPVASTIRSWLRV